MGRQVGEADGALMGKEPRLPRPGLPVRARAVGGLSRLAGVFMHGCQGKVEGDRRDLARLDVRLLQLWQRLTDVATAEGSLEVRELDEGELRRLLAFEGCTSDAQHRTRRHSGGSRRRRPGLQQGFYVLQVLVQRLLAFLDGLELFAEGPEDFTGFQVFSEPLDLFPQGLQGLAGLGQAGGSIRESEGGQGHHRDKVLHKQFLRCIFGHSLKGAALHAAAAMSPLGLALVDDMYPLSPAKKTGLC